jgi:outer membrane protein insertion porin family
VRGFATNGFGPRDLTSGTTMAKRNPRRAERIRPQGFGLRRCWQCPRHSWLHRDAVANKNVVRSSVCVGLTPASPFGALTEDYAVPITKAAYDWSSPSASAPEGFDGRGRGHSLSSEASSRSISVWATP